MPRVTQKLLPLKMRFRLRLDLGLHWGTHHNSVLPINNTPNRKARLHDKMKLTKGIMELSFPHTFFASRSESSIGGIFSHWNFRSLEPSIPWAKVTWKVRSQTWIITDYTDFEKAFYKVPHIKLISKLGSYGIDEALVKWARAFLVFTA